MNNHEFQPGPDDELLSAYLDDELSAEERTRVEARLANDPDAQQLLHQLRSVSQSVQRLPLETVGRDLRSDILGRIAELNGGTTSHQPQPAQPEPLISIFRTRRSWIWASLALAAGLLIMFLQSRDDASKRNLAAARRRSGDESHVGRELKDIKTPALGEATATTAAARERFADQPALIATDESQKDKSQIAFGVPVAPAAPAQSSEPASAGAPAASSSPTSNELFARGERQRVPMAAPALADNASLPTRAARALDKASEQPASAAAVPETDALATSEPRTAAADNNLGYDRAPAGVAGGPSTRGGAFGAMSAPKEAPASAPSPVERLGGKIATGSAAGSAIVRAPAATGGTSNGPTTYSFKGGALSESETVAEGREAKARDQLRRSPSPTFVAVVAKPEAFQTRAFESVLAQNGISIESVPNDKQEESVALGDKAKQRFFFEEQLSEKADKAVADNADEIAFVVEAPRATIDKFVAELRRDQAHFASVNWQDAENGKPRNDTIADLKKVESVPAEAANRDHRGDVAEKAAASPGQKQNSPYQTARDAARAKSSRARDIGAASNTAGQPFTDDDRKTLASAPPARGWAWRVTPRNDETGRLVDSSAGGGALGPGAAAASESRQSADAESVKLKFQSPASESVGNNDNVRVLFVISREAEATTSAPAENPAK